MNLDYIYHNRLFFAVGGFFLIWGTLVTIRRIRGMMLPKPSEDDINILFDEMEKIPLKIGFDDRIDSETSNLDIFKDHIDKYFGNISAPAKQCRLLFVADDLWMKGGYKSGGNVIRGKANELLVHRAYYDGRASRRQHGFRVELKLILTTETYGAFCLSLYDSSVAVFVSSVDWDEVRDAIVDSLKQTICDHFNYSLEEQSDVGEGIETAKEINDNMSDEYEPIPELKELAREESLDSSFLAAEKDPQRFGTVDRDELGRGQKITRYGYMIGIVCLIAIILVPKSGPINDYVGYITVPCLIIAFVIWIHGISVQKFAGRGEKHPGFGKGQMPTE